MSQTQLSETDVNKIHAQYEEQIGKELCMEVIETINQKLSSQEQGALGQMIHQTVQDVVFKHASPIDRGEVEIDGSGMTFRPVPREP